MKTCVTIAYAHGNKCRVLQVHGNMNRESHLHICIFAYMDNVCMSSFHCNASCWDNEVIVLWVTKSSNHELWIPQQRMQKSDARAVLQKHRLWQPCVTGKCVTSPRVTNSCVTESLKYKLQPPRVTVSALPFHCFHFSALMQSCVSTIPLFRYSTVSEFYVSTVLRFQDCAFPRIYVSLLLQLCDQEHVLRFQPDTSHCFCRISVT